MTNIKTSEYIGWPLKTASDLINAFGGTGKTAGKYGVVPGAVSNWRKTGLPPRLHYRIFRDAQALGLELDPMLFLDTSGE